MSEEKKVIGIEGMCFKCNAVWNISLLKSSDRGVCCENCGGYVVTPDGKIQSRHVYEGEEIKSPLLDPSTEENNRKEYKPEDIPSVIDFNKFKR